MRDDDFDIDDDDVEELQRQLDDVFEDEPAHKERFIKAVIAHLKALPAGALITDIPARDIAKIFDRTGN